MQVSKSSQNYRIRDFDIPWKASWERGGFHDFQDELFSVSELVLGEILISNGRTFEDVANAPATLERM